VGKRENETLPSMSALRNYCTEERKKNPKTKEIHRGEGEKKKNNLHRPTKGENQTQANKNNIPRASKTDRNITNHQ